MKSTEDRQLYSEQRKLEQRVRELYVAQGKNRAMKRVFKGIYSYPTRKVLFEIGQRRIKEGHSRRG